MIMHTKAPARVRGPQRVRMETPANPTERTATADALARAFEEFKAAHQQELADVVKRDEVARIDTAIADMQASLDDYNTRLTGIATNGAEPAAPAEATDPAYRELFNGWFRSGRGDDEVRNQQFQGPRADISQTPDADGGYLAPIEWDRTVTRALRNESPIRQISGAVTVTTPGFTRLYDLDGTASGWVDEKTDARSETATPTLGSVQFDVHELYAMPASTQRMLDDAQIDVESWLATAVTEKFVDEEYAAFIAGDGDKKPHGILDYVTGGASAARHPFGAIELVSSGVVGAVAADGIMDLVYDLPTQYRRNARFAMNTATMAAIRKLKDAEENYLWLPGLAEGQPATLLGYAISEVSELDDVANDALPIIFGDFGRGYLVVDRIGIRVLRDPFSAKPKVLFYTTKRVGGGVNDPRAFRVQSIPAS